MGKTLIWVGALGLVVAGALAAAAYVWPGFSHAAAVQEACLDMQRAAGRMLGCRAPEVPDLTLAIAAGIAGAAGFLTLLAGLVIKGVRGE
jgi:hypothetical protein